MSRLSPVPPWEPVIFDRSYTLHREISAIQVMPSSGESGSGLGPVTRLPSGAMVQACGPGFDNQTLKVRFQGQLYFVFLQDLEALKKAAASAS